MRRVLPLLGALLVASGLVACSDDGPSPADERAAQVRRVAAEVGLPDDVVDVLALAARGSLATYRVTYAGREGAEIVVAQQPPDQRVDVVAAGTVVESRVRRGDIAYRCEREAVAADLTCTRAAGSLEVPGAFTEAALEEFARQLAASADAVVLTVERRTIAATEATCLVSAPKAEAPAAGSAPQTDTICLSPEGAQLLLDAGGERLVADSYTTDVPDGTFDV